MKILNIWNFYQIRKRPKLISFRHFSTLNLIAINNAEPIPQMVRVPDWKSRSFWINFRSWGLFLFPGELELYAKLVICHVIKFSNERKCYMQYPMIYVDPLFKMQQLIDLVYRLSKDTPWNISALFTVECWDLNLILTQFSFPLHSRWIFGIYRITDCQDLFI